jgi:hypothetical protein
VVEPGWGNIDELTTSVTGFIRKCIFDFVPTVKVRCFPNQKPKEDSAVICPMMALYKTNSMHFMDALTITPCLVGGPPPTQTG